MSQTAEIQLEASWLERLREEFGLPYMRELKAFLRSEKAHGKVIYPRGDEIFAAFDHTPVECVRVVILGQDPYHGPGQAHGLCFSVRPGVALPPSLANIYRELEQDLGITMPNHGCLNAWADQGVLLLNSVLTVERGRAASHRDRGWEQFTDRAVEIVNRDCEHVVFMLWGTYAQRKGAVIDTRRHCVLRAPHPSPLSAHRGFFGCRHFSRANDYLVSMGREPIDWRLPENPESQPSSG
jgi:uracil-DNA glycosylase